MRPVPPQPSPPMRRIPFLLVAVAILSACDKSKAALDDSVGQVAKISAEKDSLLRDVVATSQFITAVNGELALAKGSGVDKPVIKGSGDLADTLTPAQARDAVQQRVAALVSRLNESEGRLAASRARVAKLVKGTAEAKAQIAAFDSTIAAFKVMVEGQRQQVASLTEQVAALTAENATLIKDKTQLITEKGQLTTEKEQLSTEKGQLVTEKNTVYYIVGTRDDLVKLHILEMTGGFLGLGRTAVHSRPDHERLTAVLAPDRLAGKLIPGDRHSRTRRVRALDRERHRAILLGNPGITCGPGQHTRPNRLVEEDSRAVTGGGLANLSGAMAYR